MEGEGEEGRLKAGRLEWFTGGTCMFWDREQVSRLSTKLNEAVTMTVLARGLSQALQSFSGYSMNRYLRNKQQK